MFARWSLTICNATADEVEKYADPILWRHIRELALAMPSQFIICRWVPSHLDEPADVEKRRRYFADGTTTLQHIYGNSKADDCAKRGAECHSPITSLLRAASFRRRLAVTCQSLLVAV